MFAAGRNLESTDRQIEDHPPQVDGPRTMQLRVARLCLDCEELHVADVCPVCASGRYAYVSPWLPSEERRKWRRAAPRPAHGHAHAIGKVWNAVATWFGGGQPEPRPMPRTRASDHVPSLDFEPPIKTPPKVPSVDPHHTPVTRPRS